MNRYTPQRCDKIVKKINLKQSSIILTQEVLPKTFGRQCVPSSMKIVSLQLQNLNKLGPWLTDGRPHTLPSRENTDLARDEVMEKPRTSIQTVSHLSTNIIAYVSEGLASVSSENPGNLQDFACTPRCKRTTLVILYALVNLEMSHHRCVTALQHCSSVCTWYVL